MVEVTEWAPFKNPEIPQTAVYGIDVATNVELYKDKLKAPVRWNDSRRKEGEKVESRFSHLEKHSRDFRKLGAKTVEEALPKLGEIAANTDPNKVRHFIDGAENRLIVWEEESRIAVIVQTDRYKAKDAAPPPPPVIITAYGMHPHDVAMKLNGEAPGSKWRAEPIKTETYVH